MQIIWEHSVLVQKNTTRSEIDVQDIITLLCRFREERYQFERPLALVAFSAWTMWPNDTSKVIYATIIAGTLVIQMLQNGTIKAPNNVAVLIETLARRIFPPATDPALLINPPVIGGFSDEFEIEATSRDDAANIV